MLGLLVIVQYTNGMHYRAYAKKEAQRYFAVLMWKLAPPSFMFSLSSKI